MYHLITDLLRPYTFLMLLGTLFVIALWVRRPDARRRLAWFTLIWLALLTVSMPAISHLALGSLEWRYPPQQDRPADTPAIVILAGYLRPADELRTWEELGADSVYRCLRGAELYHAGEPCVVVVSGGIVDPEGTVPIAEKMAEFLIQLGVDEEHLLVESESNTTFENAREVAKRLEPFGVKDIVLVTHATHLLRATMCFKRQGLNPTPRGAYYRATSFEWSPAAFIPSAGAATGVNAAAHEWLGILWYRIQGRI